MNELQTTSTNSGAGVEVVINDNLPSVDVVPIDERVEAREIFKDPVTDRGEKKSAKGLLRVEKNGKDFVLHDQQTWEQAMQGEMRVVFRDGQMYNVQSLADIRARLAAELV